MFCALACLFAFVLFYLFFITFIILYLLLVRKNNNKQHLIVECYNAITKLYCIIIKANRCCNWYWYCCCCYCCCSCCCVCN